MAEAKAEHHEGEHHGVGRYVLVYVTLMVLTGLTVWTGTMDFGNANIIIALIIACGKATLVVLFFMHLWDEGSMNRLVFVLSVFFVGLLMLGTFSDIWYRLDVTLPTGVPNPPWNAQDLLLEGGGAADHAAAHSGH